MSSRKIAIAVTACALLPVLIGLRADRNLTLERWERAASSQHQANRFGVEMIRDRLGFVRAELVARATAGPDAASVFQPPQLIGMRSFVSCPAVPTAAEPALRDSQACQLLSPSLRRWALDDSSAGEVRLSGLLRRGGRTLVLMVTSGRRDGDAIWIASIDATHLGEQVLRQVAQGPRAFGFLRVGDEIVASFPQSLPRRVEERVPELVGSAEVSGWREAELAWTRHSDTEERVLVSWWKTSAEGQQWMLGSIVPAAALGPNNHFPLLAGLLVGFMIALSGLASLRLHRSRQELFEAFSKEQERAREIGDRAWQNAFLGQLSDRLGIQMDDATIREMAAREIVTALRATRGLVYLRSSDSRMRLACQYVEPLAAPLRPHAELEELLNPDREFSRIAERDLSMETEPELRRLHEGFDVQAFVVAPIYRAGESIGALVIHECARARVWSEAEQRLVQRVGDRIGAAMEQSALFRAQKSVAEIRSGLLNLAHALSSERSTHSVLDLATSIAPTIRRIRRSFVLVSGDSGGWELAAQKGFEAEAPEARRALDRSLGSFLSQVVERSEAVEISHAKLREDARLKVFGGPLLMLPLVYGRELLGVFVFERFEDGPEDEADEGALEAATVISELTAAALKNAKLFEALQASEAKYVDLYDNAPEMYSTIDAAGVILDCNETQCRLLGCRKEDLLGARFSELLTHESLLTFVRVQRQLLAMSQVRDVALTLDDESAGGLDILMTAAAVYGPSGEVTGARIVMRDMSQLKELELQLQHSQKHQTLGSLVSGVAHDFNNILTGIMGHASLLRTQLTELSVVSRHLDTIERSAVRGSQLTERLLNATRKGPVLRTPTELNQIVDETLDLLERTFPKNLVLEKRLEARMSPFLADPSQIQQIVMNLCVNARDAMPEGGALRIVTEPLPEGGARLVVEDSGQGMSSETLEHIFEPYFTTKGASGSGLGLSVVYGIVKSYGGDIQVRTEPGAGSRFEVTFPARPEVGVSKPVRSAAGPEPLTAEGELILLVDDDPELLEVASAMLESKGYRVETVRSGEAALGVLRRADHGISLVILDIEMPGLDGLETQSRIREFCPEVPVLLTSGLRGGNRPPEGLKDRGVQGFVAKPYTPDDLASTVADVLHPPSPPSVH